MMNYNVEYYETKDGTRPAEEFILSLNAKMRAKIFRLLTLLESSGNELREPYSRYLRNGIFELRAQVGSDITRVLYFFVVNRTIILTNGFIKKTQQTPDSVISIAEKYRKDYQNRN